MTSRLDNCSVIKEIKKAEDAIDTCYKRVRLLEHKLQENSLPLNKQEDAQKELAEVYKLLQTNEALLSKLHSHNRKSFTMALFAAFIFFTLYMLYVLVVGLDSK